jgi:hypothetical protein
MEWTEPVVALTPTEVTGGTPGAGTPATGSVIDFEQIRDVFLVQAVVSGFGGGGGFGTYGLTGSIDNENWYGIAGDGEITEAGVIFSLVTTVPARYVQATASAYSSEGGDPETVTVGVTVAAK